MSAIMRKHEAGKHASGTWVARCANGELEFAMQTTVSHGAQANRNVNRNVFQEPATGRTPNAGAQRLLEAARNLAPTLAARAAEIEAGRQIPKDIIEALRALHMFKALVPASHGGLGLSVPDILPVLETLAAGDASVGWVMMVVSVGQLFSSRMQRALYDRIFSQDPDPMVIGVGTPVGRAEKTASGYRVSGRWPFSSGCRNAEWICGHCVVFEGGNPVMDNGAPLTIFVVLPADQWKIEDTWHVSGLAGSGSHHVRIDDVEVPKAQTCDAFRDPSCIPGYLESAFFPFMPITHAAIALGIASAAFADIMAIASGGKRQLFATSDLRDSTQFQHEVGRIGVELRAVRSLLEAESDALGRRAVDGTLDNKADFTQALQTTGWIHVACKRVVDLCYELAGSAVIASPLERRLRDMHMMAQHVLSGERFYAKAGALHLGFPPVDPFSGH
jgi:alkylation response protein AidB-like acyl-CoA dehydrogenase